MCKIKIVKENETDMQFGDYTYQAKENTLILGTSLIEKFSQLNPDEGGDSSE